MGYPLGLVSHLALGWVLVTFGGVFLVALGTVTVRRIHHQAHSGATETIARPHPSQGEQRE
ncbi:MAG: hypothetical protein DLM57_05045 [Pseudonocardiales bacterium]|nr:MAG: hypothetical protein DLM57_05045 [Pseudonocardiales bacterium]